MSSVSVRYIKLIHPNGRDTIFFYLKLVTFEAYRGHFCARVSLIPMVEMSKSHRCCGMTCIGTLFIALYLFIDIMGVHKIIKLVCVVFFFSLAVILLR